tara:strand:- start:143 stop:805 length:663 start_codon:yes stop_codon:yes gene_type:complete
MATLDEIRLQQLLQNFQGPQGIATLNPLAFQYQDQQYFPGKIPQLMEEPDIAPEYGLNLMGNDLPYLKELTPTTDMGATGTILQQPANRLEGLNFNRFQSLPANMGVANEEDVEQEFLPDQEPSGIAKLFEFLGKIPTPFNLVRKGLGSLKGFNQKLRGSTFALSPTLSDYFKAKKMERKAAIGADRPGDGGDRGSRRGDADIAGKDRGSFKTDDTAGFF